MKGPNRTSWPLALASSLSRANGKKRELRDYERRIGRALENVVDGLGPINEEKKKKVAVQYC